VSRDTSSWYQQLRETRERLGVSRKQLSQRCGVPLHTLRRWEDGSRHPTFGGLRRVLDVLDCPNAAANDILVGAGFAPSRTLFASDRFPNYFYTAEELQQAVEDVSWPEFVLDDNGEVVAANLATQATWQIDFSWERTHRTAAQLNVLGVASDHRFADRCVNWDEVVSKLVAAFKGRPREPQMLDQLDPYFEAVLAEFLAGDPVFLRRLMDVFVKTPPMDAKCRWTFPVVWRDVAFGEMRFLNVINTASEPDGLAFNDWIPQDAATWETLERVKARGVPAPR